MILHIKDIYMNQFYDDNWIMLTLAGVGIQIGLAGSEIDAILFVKVR